MKPYDKYAAQSEMFMVSIIPMMLSYLPKDGTHYEVLDIGSRSGHGAALLQRVLSKNAGARISMNVIASNLNEQETLWLKDCFGEELPCVTFDVNNDEQRELVGTYDIVIASHMIEHTKDTKQTFRNIASMAKKMFIIACPYMEEKLHHGTWWHDSSVGKETLIDIIPPNQCIVIDDVGYPYCKCFYGIYLKGERK